MQYLGSLFILMSVRAVVYSKGKELGGGRGEKEWL